MARCRYCWQNGHNRRTCPKLTAALKRSADAAIEAGNPDAWAVQQYQDRIAPKGKKKSQQTCGYCRERGHTRRKCDVLHNDREWFTKHHNEHVRAAHDYIVTSPVGIGSLFRRQRREYDYNTSQYTYKNVMFVLTDFHLEPAIQQNGIHIVACLSSTVDGDIHHLALRDYVVNPNYGQKWSGSMNLVHAMAQVVPSGWVKRKSIAFEDTAKHSFFKRVGRKDDDTRNWDFNRMDNCRETISRYRKSPDPHYDHAARAEAQLVRWTVAHNRARIFEDFKNGQ